MMNNGIDLTPLDPDRDPAWREHLVRGVMTGVRSNARVLPDARPTPASSRRDTLSELLALTRPSLVITFAAAVMMIFVSSIRTSAVDRPRRSDASPVERYAVAEALGMPGAVASWVEGGRAPSAGEVLGVLGGY